MSSPSDKTEKCGPVCFRHVHVKDPMTAEKCYPVKLLLKLHQRWELCCKLASSTWSQLAIHGESDLMTTWFVAGFDRRRQAVVSLRDVGEPAPHLFKGQFTCFQGYVCFSCLLVMSAHLRCSVCYDVHLFSVHTPVMLTFPLHYLDDIHFSGMFMFFWYIPSFP